jgi:hypothetical protein
MLPLALSLHLPRFSSEGFMFLLHLFLEDMALVAPIHLEAPVIHSLLVTRFLLEVNLKLGGNLNLGVKLKLGHNLNLWGNLRLESITHYMDRMHLDYNPTFGTFFPKEIHNHLGGNILKLTPLYPLTLVNCIQVP